MGERQAHADTIERDDTIRFVGKRQRWIVNSINGDTLTVWASIGSRRNRHEITRTVARSRVELVRKGNKDDDALAKMGLR